MTRAGFLACTICAVLGCDASREPAPIAASPVSNDVVDLTQLKLGVHTSYAMRVVLPPAGDRHKIRVLTPDPSIDYRIRTIEAEPAVPRLNVPAPTNAPGYEPPTER